MLNLTKKQVLQDPRKFVHDTDFYQKSAEFDVSNFPSVSVFIQTVAHEAVAIIAPGVVYNIEGSADKSGPFWTTLATAAWAAGGVTPNADTLNGAVLAGANSVILTDSTGYLAGDLMLLYDGGDTTFATSEICRIADIATNTVYLYDPLLRNHLTGIVTFSKGLEVYNNILNQTNLQRLRVGIRHTAATGPDFWWRASVALGYTVW
jgi:hypothetical protein